MKGKIKMQEIIILCGGRGKRMDKLTAYRQKCLLKFNGKPILQYVLETLDADLPGSRVVMAIGYKGDDIKKRFGVAYKTLELSYTSSNQYGTKAALLSAEKLTENERFFLVDGDIILSKGNLQMLREFKSGLGAIFCINDDVTAPTHPIVMEENLIIKTVEYTGKKIRKAGALRWMSTGYWSRELFRMCRESASKTITGTVAKNIRERVSVVIYKGKWNHFAEPDDLSDFTPDKIP